jgi:chromosome segregation ATPase
VDRLTAHEGSAAIKSIMEDLRRAEQAVPLPSVVHEPVVSVHEVDAMMHTKEHEIREVSSQLEVARVDIETAALQLESAVKQRDHWKVRYETDMENLRNRQTKERELDASEKEGLQRENLRLQKEIGMLQHEIIKLKNELSTEVVRSQMLEQEIQRAPSESISEFGRD